jgi:site-specific recombinase XerD
MSAVAPTLEAFFTERLGRQRNASPHTVAAYRDAFRLLLTFAQQRTGKAPSQLDFADLDAPLVACFLDHLEEERHNSVRTRNARLAALRSFYRYAAYREPAHAEVIRRVLAIPEKRTRRTVVSFLTGPEIAALVASPDRTTWQGRRDHALLVTAAQTGVRVSELTALCNHDVVLGSGAHILVHGKGRKERVTPLTRSTAAVLAVWMKERRGEPDEALFPTLRGSPLSRDAVADLVAKYSVVAERQCPSLSAKKVTPHVLRHSCAMQLLHAGVDTSVIALWLGHEHVQSTQIYLHGDLSIKERALARIAPQHTPPGRYRPPDKLLAFLKGL